MWKKGVVTLSKAFHYDVAQMISLFQDYLDNPPQPNLSHWAIATTQLTHFDQI
jgi:hypothetical protein